MLRGLISVLVLAVLVGCASGPRMQVGADTRRAIEKMNAELCERYNRGDRAGVAAMYADDAIMIDHEGRRYVGRAEIDEYWTPRRPPAPGDHWELEVLSIEGDAESPVQRGRSRLRWEHDGKTGVSDVQFVVFWKRQPAGDYRIVLDAWWPTESE